MRVWPSTCSGKCWGWGWSCESDHQHPHILMWVWPSNIFSPIKMKKTFIFDKCWLDNEDIKRIFTDGWNYTYLPQNTTIIDQVFSCRRAWVNEYENVQNSEKQVEEFKEKVDNLYSSDWVDMPQQWTLRRLWKYWLCFKYRVCLGNRRVRCSGSGKGIEFQNYFSLVLNRDEQGIR